MAHVLNLTVQRGLKELGNSSLISLCLERVNDEECEEDEIEVTSQRPSGVIIHQLRTLVLAANSTLMKHFHAVVEYTRSRVKTKSKLTNLKINSRIEGYNGK